MDRRRKEDKVIRFIYAVSCLIIAMTIAFLGCYDDSFHDVMSEENTIVKLRTMDIPDYIDTSSKKSIVYSILQNHVKTILLEYLKPIGDSGKYTLNKDEAEAVFDRIERVYDNAEYVDKETTDLIIEYINEFK